jgi:hypothetical protein
MRNRNGIYPDSGFVVTSLEMSLFEERAARNEALFREVNEQVATLAARDDEAASFVCECSDADCMHRIRVPLRSYEEVRSHPRRFIVRAGHESAFEHVIERRGDYSIVEKEGLAGRVADSHDPRS